MYQVSCVLWNTCSRGHCLTKHRSPNPQAGKLFGKNQRESGAPRKKQKHKGNNKIEKN